MKSHDLARLLLNGPNNDLVLRDFDGNIIELKAEHIQINTGATEQDNVTIEIQ